MAEISVEFSQARGECLTLTLSLEAIPCNIAISDIPLKITFSGLHFRRILQPLLRNPPRKPTEFDEITVPLGLLRRSRSFKVIDFGTNRKLIYDFLLVINSNLSPILHRF